MKKLITVYAFNPTAKTITLTGYDSIDIRGLLLITNVTDNIVIYNFADPAKGGTTSENIITLTYDTSSMDAGDDLQIFYDDGDEFQKVKIDKGGEGISIPITDRNGLPINAPVIEEALQSISKREDTGEQLTFDTNLPQIFGPNDLRGPKGSIRVEPLPTDIFATGVISVGRPIFSMIVNGYATAIISIGGTWTGTISFEAWAGGAGDVVAIAGISMSTIAVIPVLTTTANGAFRFNIAGMQQIRARFSTATTGNPTITIGASVNPSIASLVGTIVGSQGVALVQRATTYEQNTYDTNLAVVLGIASLLSPGTWATRATRLKTEIAARDVGSDPSLNNPDGSRQLQVQDAPLLRTMQRILDEQIINNKILMMLAISAGCSFEGFNETQY